MSMEEKINQAKGAVKEGLGKVTGDKKVEVEGAVEKVGAKVKEVAEDAKELTRDAKDAIEGAIDGVKNIINKDKE